MLRFCFLTFFALVLNSCWYAAIASIEKACLKDGEIWASRDDTVDAIQLTRDGQEKDCIAVSPDKRRIAYYVAGNQQNKLISVILVLDETGRKLLEFQPKESDVDPCISILSLQWIDNYRLGIECHIN